MEIAPSEVTHRHVDECAALAIDECREPAPEANRRTIITRGLTLAGGVVSGSLLVGCKGSDRNSESQNAIGDSEKNSVALRVLWIGDEDRGSVLKEAWAMAADQGLEIEPVSQNSFFSAVDVDGENQSSAGDSIAKRMASVDVVVFPQLLLGTACASGGEQNRESLISFNENVLSQFVDRMGKPFPAVANGLGSYGGQAWGVAAGANLLALLSLDPDLSLASWSDYHDWVQKLDGKAAEPLAAGWAASSFLNRCASTISRGWLFDRNSLTPELDQPGYVAVLDQMLATCKLYQGEPKTPMQIWADLRAGKLRGAIGFQTSEREERDSDASDLGEQFDISVVDGPRESQADRIWFDARCPLVAISSGCRQSDAARRLAGWLTGGEGIANVRGQVTEFSATRTAPDGLTDSSSSAYARWLADRLQTRQVLPSLVLPAADRYHAALDQQIGACLAGDIAPQTALKSAVDQWQAITDEVGREQQVVAWKKVLGFGVA